MADDDVLDRPSGVAAVDREVERMKREREAAAAGPVHAQGKVVTLKPPAKDATQPAEPGPAKPAEDTPPPGAGPESFASARGDYKAFGWAGNKTVPTLRLILADGSQEAVMYAQLDSDPERGNRFLAAAPGFKGNVIRLRVCGSGCVFLIIIDGGGTEHIWDLIMEHKTPWLRVLPPGGMPVPGEPVIWSIRFEPIK